MGKGVAVGMIAAVAIIVGIAIFKKSSKPKLKQKANCALRAAGNFIDQLTQMTD